MRSVIILALLVSSTFCIFNKSGASPFLNKEELSTLNSNASYETYDYESHPFKNWTNDQIKGLMGANILPKYSKKATTGDLTGLPKSFDSRVQWPNCIHAIRDQQKCGSCWAFAASEVLSDRFCIASKGAINTVLSPQDMVECDYFDMGCNGGNPFLSWVYLRLFGVVTDTCKPYTSGSGDSGTCNFFKKECKDGQEYKKYKSASLPQWHKSVEDIKKSIMSEGPVEAGFMVYKDFMSYKSGIYVVNSSELLGGHAVKIVGWGQENNVDYWIVANSWNTVWGEKGFFRIKIGEAGMENTVVSGTPQL